MDSLFLHLNTVAVAQLVRASDCGSEGRGFETPQSPHTELLYFTGAFLLIYLFDFRYIVN
jgi:hypothetical protein